MRRWIGTILNQINGSIDMIYIITSEIIQKLKLKCDILQIQSTRFLFQNWTVVKFIARKMASLNNKTYCCRLVQILISCYLWSGNWKLRKLRFTSNSILKIHSKFNALLWNVFWTIITVWNSNNFNK